MEKNDFKALPDELKPREQLRRAASPRDVSEESLLAILLKTGANGCDVVELARRLLKAFGSLHALVRADGRQLERTIKDYNRSHPEKRILGIGPVKALELTAAFELVRRGFEPKADDVRLRRVTTSEDAYDVFKRGLALGDEQENFYVLPLDAKSHPLCEAVRVTRGTLDRSPVHVREVFKDAIKWGLGRAQPSERGSDAKRGGHRLDEVPCRGIGGCRHSACGSSCFGGWSICLPA